MSEEEDQDNMAFGPASLGLHRVGTILPVRPKVDLPKLNARGTGLARIRKTNRFFISDDFQNDKKMTAKIQDLAPVPSQSIENGKIRKLKKKKKFGKGLVSKEVSKPFGNSPKKATPKKSIVNSEVAPPASSESQNMSPIDKKACQRIGLRLRNLLKLPKAHKFVMYEFFYSNIDQVLLDESPDFETCIQTSFPNLKSRMMTRVEWNKVRSVMGKPRRCSQNFFDEERQELERKRQKIRLLQSQKSCDQSFVHDLPKNIPQALILGTKVTARLRHPQDGLFMGIVDSLDASKSSYKVLFDRPGIGAILIPDFEVHAMEKVESISLENITRNFRGQNGGRNISYYMVSPLKKSGPMSSWRIDDPLLTGDFYPRIPKMEQKIALPQNGLINGVSVHLLRSIVLAKKNLESKQMQLLKIRRMNRDAEMYKSSYGDGAPIDFQKRYASLIIGMEQLNRELQNNLNLLQSDSELHIPQQESLSFLTPSYLREKCRESAVETFMKNNQNVIVDDEITQLITNLATILWTSSHLKNDRNSEVSRVLQGVIEETKALLDPENKRLFQKKVLLPMRRVQLGIFNQNLDESSEDVIDQQLEIIGF